MRAVLLGVDESFLRAGEQTGQHKLDERWEGEWHLVNPPRSWHTFFNSELFRVLAVLAQQRGLLSSCEATGLFGAADDWRIPDQLYCRPDHITDSGVTSAELVVEVRSPGDESYDKLDFYAARGVAEVLIVHEDRRAELYRRRADGTMTQVEQEDRSARSDTLGCTFTTAAGPKLRIMWDGGTADV